MAKRSWDTANGGEVPAAVSPTLRAPEYEVRDTNHTKQPASLDLSGNQQLAASDTPGAFANGAPSEPPIPQISRKIKACASCRKHKIKCIMDERGPPCRRCKERNLGCVLKKSLQSILDEKTQYADAVVHDLEQLHAVLESIARKVGLPELQPLQSNLVRLSTGSPTVDRTSAPDLRLLVPLQEDGTFDPSCDNSPEMSPADETFPYAPIQSLYSLTKLRALRSPDAPRGEHSQDINDFITLGAISKDDAERLFRLYRDRLDAFMYGVGCRYNSLEELRRKSSILAAATLTVAALHDPQANALYGTCRSEFRRLVEKSMFERRVDRDYIRAMCIASYWLSDVSWILSGHAIRRAAECNLHNSYNQAIEQQSEEAADCARLWFILNICDQHLAILYGRPPIVQDDTSIHLSESFLDSPVSTEEDRRLISQVALLNIFMGIRELLGPDKGQPVPKSYLHQITHFSRQLDTWIKHWSEKIDERYPNIGRFPRKGALLHYHFAKLHLHSQVFRGLSGDTPIPYYFLDSATTAVSTAISTIEFICNDPDVAAGVVGMPSYLQGMTAYACTFLIKFAVKYGGQLVEPARVYSLTGQLVQQFRSLATGRWHLANLMAGGLERMAEPLNPNAAHQSLQPPNGMILGDGISNIPDAAGSTYHIDGPLLSLDADFFFDNDMSLDYAAGFAVDLPTISLDHPVHSV